MTGLMLEIDRSCGMPELMGGDAQARRFQDTFRDLRAKHAGGLGLTSNAWEEPIGIRAAQKMGPEVVDVLLDNTREIGIKFEIEIDAVLHVIMGKHQPE